MLTRSIPQPSKPVLTTNEQCNLLTASTLCRLPTDRLALLALEWPPNHLLMEELERRADKSLAVRAVEKALVNATRPEHRSHIIEVLTMVVGIRVGTA